MRPYNHVNATTLAEASDAVKKGAKPLAGGGDLLNALKDNIFPEYPKAVVNLKSIPGLDYIKEEDGMLKIGALTKLADVSRSPEMAEKATAIAQSVNHASHPTLREMTTVGGNLCQTPRCWYFRKLNNRFDCLRKGGPQCFAAVGENRFHSIMGGMRTHVSECKAECPAGTDIPSYLEQLRNGNWDAASEIIMQVNPMAAITGRVCVHYCQLNCNRNKYDEGVTSGYVERTVGDYMLDNADKFYTAPDTSTGKRIAIIGSGPSGLSAAFYLRKAGNKVTVYDSKQEAGGMLRYAIPEYRLPKELVTRFVNILENMGIEFQLGSAVGDTIRPADLEAQYDAVLYATGAWKRPVLGFSGEDLTVFGLDFLVEIKNWMGGKVGQEVVVMGGGNVAMDVAVSAKRLGAKVVRLTCLEPEGKMPASAEEIARAREEGIEIDPGWGLSKVVEKNGKISGLEVKRCTSPWDEAGEFNPQYDENDKKVLKGENILLATGQGVDLSFLDEKYQIQLKRGRVDVDEESNATNRPGIFASGDIVTGPGTVIGSVASGRKSAVGISRYLGVPVEVHPDVSLKEFVHFDQEGIKKTVSMKLEELDAAARAIDKEDSKSPSMEAAWEEAMRCRNCACYAVNQGDLAPAMVALDAKFQTTERSIDAENFFGTGILSSTVLDCGELLTEIQIPIVTGQRSSYKRFAFRKSIDFPVINVALSVDEENQYRICLGGVAGVPYRAVKAEELLKGKAISAELAEKAGVAAAEEAVPFETNAYKVQLIKTLVKRELLAL